jgi:hypothetical protein|tara:strand:+ start:100 stop:360 length:261 start_codon:yes stop_codon:yes gene_type:complete
MITKERAEQIKRLLWIGVRGIDVARMTGVTTNYVTRVRQGKSLWQVEWPNGWIGHLPRERDRWIRENGFVTLEEVRTVLEEMKDGS